MSNCCLTPIQQFFSYIMGRTSKFSMRWWWGPFCNNMSDKSKFYYLFTNEDLSIINIFGKCIIECLETRKLKQVLWYWNIFSLSIYIINFFLRLWTRQETLYLYIFFIYICIIASNDNNQCMQFVCPYCEPIDWNNKYSYSYSI